MRSIKSYFFEPIDKKSSLLGARHVELNATFFNNYIKNKIVLVTTWCGNPLDNKIPCNCTEYCLLDRYTLEGKSIFFNFKFQIHQSVACFQENKEFDKIIMTVGNVPEHMITGNATVLNNCKSDIIQQLNIKCIQQ